jgi:hypothetical protein
MTVLSRPPKEIDELSDAMWQLLDEMGKTGQGVCLLAKAQARVAFEPFRDKSEAEYEDWMSFAEAQEIIAYAEKKR